MNDIHYVTKTAPAPMKHQSDFFFFAWDKEYVALLAGIGTGKTRMLIDLGANRFNEGQIDAMFVIAPSGVQLQWHNQQLPEHCPIPYTSFVFRAGMGKKEKRAFADFGKAEGFKVLLTNVELFSRDTYVEELKTFLRTYRTFLIIDESQTCAHLDATRTQNILYGLSDLTKYGRRIMAVKPLAKYRAIATGSMVSNAPVDLFAPMNFLKPDYFGMSLSSFKAKYCLEKTDHVPGTAKQFRRRLSLAEMRSMRSSAKRGVPLARIATIFAVTESDISYIVENESLEVPYKNLDSLKLSIRPVSFIIKAEDCIDLPERIYEKRYVEMGAEQRKIYKELCANMETEFRGQELTATNALTLLIRLSQVTSNLYGKPDGKVEYIAATSPKIEALVERIENDQTFPCIVLSRFVAEVDEAVRALKKAFPERVVEYIVGEVDNNTREDIKSRFLENEVDILVATAGTIGTGLNLQNAAVEYYLSNDYSYTTRDQAEGRIVRQGQKAAHCVFVDFLCEGTIDMKVYEVLRSKKMLVEYMRGRTPGEFLGGK